MNRQIVMTQFDKERLDELLAVADAFRGRDREDLQDLQAEMARAEIVASEKIPGDVVTMNSQVVLRDLNTSKRLTYTLVFPRDADVGAGRISVLAPIGTAILGYRAKDTVECSAPSGTRRIRIEKILYQPEAAGDLHL